MFSAVGGIGFNQKLSSVDKKMTVKISDKTLYSWGKYMYIKCESLGIAIKLVDTLAHILAISIFRHSNDMMNGMVARARYGFRFQRSVSRVGQRQTNDATLCQQVRYALPIEWNKIFVWRIQICLNNRHYLYCLQGLMELATRRKLYHLIAMTVCKIADMDGSSGRSDVGIS